MSTPSAPVFEPSPAERFFGLAARPFSLTPDLRFAYHSRSHTHALEQVTSALRRREGLIVVTGPVGTGKTMLCRTMLESFESRTFLSVILDPGLDVQDLLRQVLTDFGIIDSVEISADEPLTDVTRHQLVTTLQQFLASLIPLNAHAVIMIDEAQRLSPRVLEEIRLLSNFETDEAKLLQIVLVGQPELDEVLHHPKMQQLNQRVARRCELQPLSETEVGDYIERRLTVAASPAALTGGVEPGITDTEGVVRFSPAAVTAVAGISGGIPRIVNTLCDRALDTAYERQLRVIDPDAVLAAAERLHLEVPGGVALPGAQHRSRLIAAAAVIAVLVVALWWWFSRPSAESSRQTPSTADRATLAGSGQHDDAPSQRPAEAADRPTTGSPAAGGAAVDTATSNGPATGTAIGTASTPSASAGAPASVPSPRPSTVQAGSFQIAVAAFRTDGRAQDVANAVTALSIPVAVRPDPTGTWYRVIAGPFASREAAQSAQDTLSRGGFTGTQVAQLGLDGR